MKAAIYLRVSTLDQAMKGNTHRDGFSIPAQREACRKKAESLKVTGIREYVDRGESARSANRPALQRLLQDLCAKKQFSYVIVHKIDRLARNVEDDVTIGLAIRQGGAQLVSVTENIDETPSGRLLHGIMATIAEFYSRNLAAEALKGATEKAKQGGTPYFAPIGYMNVIERTSQRENRTVVPDPERAALVRWGIERYASGDYSEKRLHGELARRGLRGRGRSATRPLSLSAVDRMLSNRYYLGLVSYCGVEYTGNHQPLVTPSVFAAAQAVRASHRYSRSKHHKHFHYLSRLLICERCHRHLCFSIAKRRYEYFFCMNRHAGCRQPYIPAALLEEAIIKTFEQLPFSEGDRKQLVIEIRKELDYENHLAMNDLNQQSQRLKRLENQRDSVLQAYYNKLIQPNLLKNEQKRITEEINQAEKVITEAEQRLSTLKSKRDCALALAQGLDIGVAYRKANPIMRRHFCQAQFTTVEVDDQIIDHKRGIGVWREHHVSLVKVSWHNPINIHHITEAILALSLKR